jgi:hypothetical protein
MRRSWLADQVDGLLMFVYGALVSSLITTCSYARRSISEACVDILKPFFFNDTDIYSYFGKFSLRGRKYMHDDAASRKSDKTMPLDVVDGAPLSTQTVCKK